MRYGVHFVECPYQPLGYTEHPLWVSTNKVRVVDEKGSTCEGFLNFMSDLLTVVCGCLPEVAAMLTRAIMQISDGLMACSVRIHQGGLFLNPQTRPSSFTLKAF